MPIGGLKQIPQALPSFPFRWAPEGLIYLGINVTPSFEQMYKVNFLPLFERIRMDLERWNVLPISWLGRISLLKMNILPRLLYPIQMIPINFTHKTIRKLNGWFSSFIWEKKKSTYKNFNFNASIFSGRS